MKTKQELLDFYGVEIGKRYLITNTDLKISEPKIFSVEETTYNYGGLRLIFVGNNGASSLTLLSECCYEEIKPPILDDVEREYLQHYVMDNPAFKGKVEVIEKLAEQNNEREFLAIRLKDEECYMPYFTLGSMYKGMKESERYTPKELGLKE